MSFSELSTDYEGIGCGQSQKKRFPVTSKGEKDSPRFPMGPSTALVSAAAFHHTAAE